MDPTTKTPKLSKDGQALFMVQVVSLSDSGAEVWKVKVPGKPIGLKTGIPVKITGLVASPWSMSDNRSGVSFRADRIEPITATR